MQTAQKFNAIIVDDEELARFDLRKVLGAFPEVVISGEAADVDSAIELINGTRPNLVFLDIQLKGETGFDLIDKCETAANIVFVTAYDKYAIRAFEVNALDYLLKPVNPDRLKLTLDKISDKTPAEKTAMRKFELDDIIFLQLRESYKFQKIKEIVAITSNGDYSFIHTTDNQKKITSKTMKEWETRLPENTFIRIHRETIINLQYVINIEDWFYSSYKIYIKGFEEPFIMSRRYAVKVKKYFG